MYILSKTDTTYGTEYLIVQVDSFSDDGSPNYTTCSTDNPFDATKFNSESCLQLVEEDLSLSLHCDLLEDYEVIRLEVK